jgi:hypothetical protein
LHITLCVGRDDQVVCHPRQHRIAAMISFFPLTRRNNFFVGSFINFEPCGTSTTLKPSGPADRFLRKGLETKGQLVMLTFVDTRHRLFETSPRLII